MRKSLAPSTQWSEIMKTMNPIIAGFVLALLSTGAQGTEISDTLSFLVGHEVVDPASGKKYMHVPAYVGPPIFGCSNFDAAQTMRRINLQNRPTFSTYEYSAMINK